MNYKTGIILSIVGIAAVLMVVIAPTLENQQTFAVTQSVDKKVSVKDPRMIVSHKKARAMLPRANLNRANH